MSVTRDQLKLLTQGNPNNSAADSSLQTKTIDSDNQTSSFSKPLEKKGVKVLAYKLEEEIEQRQQEVDELKREIKQDKEVKQKLYDALNKRKDKLESIKQEVYKPDGKTKRTNFSFYDQQRGATAKLHVFNKAMERLASKSHRFYDDMNELRETSTYSNLNLRQDSLERLEVKHAKARDGNDSQMQIIQHRRNLTEKD